jgi:hypothetical protein
MSVSPAEAKQAVIRQLLQSLAAAQTPAVQVRLLARINGGPAGIRGILNPSPRPAVPPPQPVDESPLPPPFREDASPSLTSLRLGHELHVVVTSARRGYLHLFNLGSSGEARRMLPRPGETPVLLEPGRAHLASAAPGAPWVEQGPVNGFPERILAIVTAQSSSVPASFLHPSFSDAAVARGFSPPMVDALLAAWPAADWAWGDCEARVEN